VAVVGDHEQVSPLAVGQQVDDLTTLIAEHLDGVPNAVLYDGKTSIYDLARQSFGGTIALREHFRCVPDIIEFSNRLSYDGAIRPLRDPSRVRRPYINEVVTSHQFGRGREEKRNESEARWVVGLMHAMTHMTEYDGRSLGAISLLGQDQADLIEDLAVQHIGAVELERRHFAAGNPAQFQGDERDVILLSMVDSPTGFALRMAQDDPTKQRYNVAASRARDQLWLVHSLNPNRDLQTGDLRRRLIDHVRSSRARTLTGERLASKAESAFEAEVLKRLSEAGYEVEPQFWVGGYRIDIVVRSGPNQVALECDGDRYQGFDQIPADLARQAVLERVGWRFIRVRSTRFFRDPGGAMREVMEQLDRLGIHPSDTEHSAEQDAQGVGLRKEVLWRAWQFMKEQGWIRDEEGSAS
jgi:very-short-patch-repair endonuclease